jgi:hypothetical protein
LSYTTATKNAAVDAITALGDRIFLCTGDPGSTGANEDTGVPQQTTVWPSAASGQAIGTQVALAGLAAHYTHYGVRSSGGTFRYGFPLDPGVTLDAPGTVYVTPRVTFP